MKLLEGKVAARGIGKAIAMKFAQEGASVAFTDLKADENFQNTEKELQALGVKAKGYTSNAADFEDTAKVVSEIVKDFGRIDVLVNNAGLASGFEHIDEGDPMDWDKMIDTNVKGLLYITRVVSRMMIERGQGGLIVNIGSVAGSQTYADGAVYCASKHAVHALSEGMRIDLLKHGIKVSEVRPGMVETEFSVVRFHGDRQRADKVYEGVKPLSAEDIADVIGWIVSLPPHVNVNDILVMPTQQADAHYTDRKP